MFTFQCKSNGTAAEPALTTVVDTKIHEFAKVKYQATLCSICIPSLKTCFGLIGGGGAVAEWVRPLAWNGDRTFPTGFEPHFGKKNFSLRNFGNSVYPSLPVSFGGDTKSRRSLLSGVYARGSKRSHQSALECVTVVDSTSHSKTPQKCVYAAENAALH